MKRLLSILLLLIVGFFTEAQDPYTGLTGYDLKQNLGADSTIINVKGAISGRVVVYNFADTTTANTQRIKNYPGALIFTTDSSRLWTRNKYASAWNRAGATAGIITSLTFFTDSSLIICYSDGSCDTIPFTNNVFITNNTIGCNDLLAGGLVSWRGAGMIFDVTAAEYNINCKTYNSPLSAVTLSNGDASHPRLDVIAVDTNSQVVVIAGTPAANPVKPQIDPASQLELTTILIPAGATTPGGITLEVIYNENLGTPTEWAGVANAWTPTVNADLNNTANPFLGSKDILISTTGTPTIAASSLVFTAADTVQFTGGWNLLKLWVSLNTALSNGQGFQFQLYFNFNPVSNVVNFLPGQFTYSGTTVGSYQPLVIPWGAFIPLDTAFNQLVIRPINGAKGMYIDYIQLQAGLDDSTSAAGGRFIENQFSYYQPANFKIQGIGQANMFFTSPNLDYIGSEKYGLNSSSTGIYATSVGALSAATETGATTVGAQALGKGVTIGYGAFTNSSSSVAVGGQATGTGIVQVGRDGNVTANEGIAIGESVDITGARSIAIGYGSQINHSTSIAFGHSAVSTATNQFVVGSSSIGYSSWYAPNGVTAASLSDLTINGTGGSGSNIAGANIITRAGLSTGNATPAGFEWWTGNVGSSGSTLQTATKKMDLDNTNGLTLTDIRFEVDKGTNTAAANDLTLPNDGNLFTITGATTINAITTTNWQAGSLISFVFTGAPLVKNNTAGGAGTATILLAGRTDYQAAAGDYIQFQYDGTNWYETNRALAASPGGGSVNAANNGTSLSGTTTVQLGQAVGAVGNPAILLNSREIPMGGFTLALNASATQSVNIFQTTNSSAAVRARITSAASFSNANGFTGAEMFGDGANAAGVNATAIGNAAVASEESTVIGRASSGTSSTHNVQVGKSSIITSTNPATILIGHSTLASGAGGSTIVIGNQGTTTGAGGVGIGHAVTLSNSNNIVIGNQAIVAHTYSQVYGAFATSTAGNQVVFGGTQSGGSVGSYHYFLGGGVVNISGGVIEDIDIQPTGAFGTNTAGVDMYLNGAKATGNAAGGEIYFGTSDAGASGASLQSVTPKAVLSGKVVGIGILSGFTATRLQVLDLTLDDDPMASFLITSTAASGNSQRGVEIAMNGANANSTQTTYAFDVSNTHTGTSSSNVAARFQATSGTNNYALIVPPAAGNVGLGTATPSSAALLELASTTQALLIMRMTAAQASAITAANGMLLYVTDTDATFTSVGFWGREAGAWVKL